MVTWLIFMEWSLLSSGPSDEFYCVNYKNEATTLLSAILTFFYPRTSKGRGEKTGILRTLRVLALNSMNKAQKLSHASSLP